MSQAEELLDSLVEAYAAETKNDSDQHIVIGTDRVIVVPEELKRIAVQYDHNMRTVTFDCPRYYDGRDMSKMKVYITIEGPLGARSSYIADNVRVDNKNSNVMHFDWTIKRTVTSVSGSITFLICIRNTDSEGNEENHWNSELNSEMYISKGMEYNSETIESEYPDIVSQLLDRMNTVETNASAEAMQGYTDNWLNNNVDTVLNDIQIKGAETLESIPEDYMTTYKYASEGARSKADAIIRTVEGNTISVADSSDDYVRGLRVFGKTTQITTTGAQLIPYPYNGLTNESDEVTWAINEDHSISVSGTPTAQRYYALMISHTLPVGVYTVSGCPEGGMYQKYWMYVQRRSDNYVWYEVGNGVTFEVTAEDTFDIAVNVGASAGTISNLTFYPMLNVGSTALPWEPYTGGVASPSPEWPQDLVSIENPTVNIYGNNLLSGTIVTGTVSGVTRTVNADGSITIKGTSTDVHGLIVSSTIELPNGTYAVTGGKAAAPLTIFGDSVNGGGWVSLSTDSGNGCEFVADDSLYNRYLAQYHMEVGYVFDTTLYPMIRSVVISDSTYEPYKDVQALAITRSLPGIPVTSGGNYTDTNGQQWICDEVNFERGVYVQRIDIATLANSYTEYSVLSATGRGQLIIAPTPAKNQYLYGTICNMAIRNSDALSAVHGEYYENPANIVLVGNVGDTEVAMREKFADVKYLYALATPIEIPLTAEELNSFAALRTNYPNTTVLNDSNVKMELKYNADTQLYIDNKIAEVIASLINNT